MNEIRKSTTYSAPIGRVWSYLTEPDKIAKWLMPNTFQPVLGHEFTMDCPPGIGSGAPVQCRVTAFAPPQNGRAKLAYSWAIDSPPIETLLTIDLQDDGGVTRLDLVHAGWDGLGPADMYVRDRHQQGWDHLLDNLLRTELAA